MAGGLAFAPGTGRPALARADADADAEGTLWPGSTAMGIAISPPAMIALTGVLPRSRGILTIRHPPCTRIVNI
jgi:hypothetical protein